MEQTVEIFQKLQAAEASLAEAQHLWLKDGHASAEHLRDVQMQETAARDRLSETLAELRKGGLEIVPEHLHTDSTHPWQAPLQDVSLVAHQLDSEMEAEFSLPCSPVHSPSMQKFGQSEVRPAQATSLFPEHTLSRETPSQASNSPWAWQAGLAVEFQDQDAVTRSRAESAACSEEACLSLELLQATQEHWHLMAMHDETVAELHAERAATVAVANQSTRLEEAMLVELHRMKEACERLEKSAELASASSAEPLSRPNGNENVFVGVEPAKHSMVVAEFVTERGEALKWQVRSEEEASSAEAARRRECELMAEMHVLSKSRGARADEHRHRSYVQGDYVEELERERDQVLRWQTMSEEEVFLLEAACRRERDLLTEVQQMSRHQVTSNDLQRERMQLLSELRTKMHKTLREITDESPSFRHLDGQARIGLAPAFREVMNEIMDTCLDQLGGCRVNGSAAFVSHVDALERLLQAQSRVESAHFEDLYRQEVEVSQELEKQYRRVERELLDRRDASRVPSSQSLRAASPAPAPGAVPSPSSPTNPHMLVPRAERRVLLPPALAISTKPTSPGGGGDSGTLGQEYWQQRMVLEDELVAEKACVRTWKATAEQQRIESGREMDALRAHENQSRTLEQRMEDAAKKSRAEMEAAFSEERSLALQVQTAEERQSQAFECMDVMLADFEKLCHSVHEETDLVWRLHALIRRHAINVRQNVIGGDPSFAQSAVQGCSSSSELRPSFVGLLDDLRRRPMASAAGFRKTPSRRSSMEEDSLMYSPLESPSMDERPVAGHLGFRGPMAATVGIGYGAMTAGCSPAQVQGRRMTHNRAGSQPLAADRRPKAPQAPPGRGQPPPLGGTGVFPTGFRSLRVSR